MAKLSDLIPTLAEVVGMPDTAVGAYARRLRKAGKISSGGRGPGGAEMTPRDCANLLIAVMAGTPTYAVERIRLFRSLICAPEGLGEGSAPLLAMLKLGAGHGFADMLERLISIATESPVRKQAERMLIDGGLIPTEFPEILRPHVSVSIEIPDVRALLTVAWHKFEPPGYSDDLRLYYLPRKYWKNKGRSSPDDPVYGDLRHEVTVHANTIDALGQLLATNAGKRNVSPQKKA